MPASATAQRLKLLDGDFPGAAAIALQRGNRFGNANAYRDYLSLLHVMGRGDEAWRTFWAGARRL